MRCMQELFLAGQVEMGHFVKLSNRLERKKKYFYEFTQVFCGLLSRYL